VNKTNAVVKTAKSVFAALSVPLYCYCTRAPYYAAEQSEIGEAEKQKLNSAFMTSLNTLLLLKCSVVMCKPECETCTFEYSKLYMFTKITAEVTSSFHSCTYNIVGVTARFAPWFQRLCAYVQQVSA